MNWKEQIREWCEDFPIEAAILIYHVEKEVIEKLIADIPEDVGYIVRSPNPHVPPMNIPLKQQLRAKWL
jgi:hypothetical protein